MARGGILDDGAVLVLFVGWLGSILVMPGSVSRENAEGDLRERRRERGR